MKLIIIYIAIFLSLFSYIFASIDNQKTKRSIDKKLNVHLAMHSHDDPGWLKTADQYFYGSNTTIYEASVQYMFDTLVQQLEDDPSKTWLLVEMSFFQRWWAEQTPLIQKKVKKFVKNGQMTFANGGWVMHDEASSHYVSQVDQTTLGHRFIKEEFDVAPRVGWQIDPFGHSSTAQVFFSEFGFDSLFFGRINYDELDMKKKTQELEFVWDSSQSLQNTYLLTGVFSDGNYGPPPGICFDRLCGPNNDPVMDDERLTDYNADTYADLFISGIDKEASYTKGDHIMLKMGSDFHYSNARQWMKNIDKLIPLVMKKRPDLNLFYSSPEQYTLARAEENLEWKCKKDDYFPYRDCDSCNWAGYFTSRPGLKLLERQGSRTLQVLKQVLAYSASQSNNEDISKHEIKSGMDHIQAQLTAAVGLINHHDAMTGTSKQHVADDYTKKLSDEMTTAEDTIGTTLHELMFESKGTLQACRMMNETSCDISTSLKENEEMVVVAMNPLSHSGAGSSTAAPRKSQLTVLLGPAANPDVTTITVEDITSNKVVASQILRTSPMPDKSTINNDKKSKNMQETAPFTLVFESDFDGLYGPSVKSFKISLKSKTSVKTNEEALEGMRRREKLPLAGHLHESSEDLIVEKGELKLTFDAKTGLLSKVARKGVTDNRNNGDGISITQSLGYYRAWQDLAFAASPHSHDDRDPHVQNLVPVDHVKGPSHSSTQPSGAYILRTQEPKEQPTPVQLNKPVELRVEQGELVTEVYQRFSDWAVQVIRIKKDSPLIEVEYTVGAVPIEDGIGKEVISRISSELDTGSKIYTDSNGREFMPRERDHTTEEFVAGNYYPITAGAYIKEDNTNTNNKKIQLSVMSDRGVGAASLKEGQLELLIHRRLLQDDYRGVNEPLNETTGGMSPYPDWERSGDGITIRGTQYILLSNTDDETSTKTQTTTDVIAGGAMMELRQFMDSLFLPVYLLYSSHSKVNPQSVVKSSFSLVGAEMPSNTMLMSLQKWKWSNNNKQLLVRVSHQFAINEGPLATEAVVDLNALLAPYKPQENGFQEMSLSANMLREEMEKRKIHWQYKCSDLSKNEKENEEKRNKAGSKDDDVKSGKTITLKPMQIRTFIVTLQ